MQAAIKPVVLSRENPSNRISATPPKNKIDDERTDKQHHEKKDE